MIIIAQNRIRRYASGLFYREYDGYRATPADLDTLQGNTGVNTELNNFTIGTTDTVVWRGLFLPDADSTSWQFRTRSDDGSFLWIGSTSQAADANLDTNDAVVDKVYVNGEVWVG